MTQPEVYKVIGAPGTGKTTRVVGNPELEDHQSLIQQNLEEYPLQDQAIVTYTRAGVEEAQDRLYKMHDYTKKTIKDRVLTIHSYCYHALGVDQDQVVNWWNKQNFCDMMDLEYGNSDDDGDIMSNDADEGHSFYQIYGWLKSNMKNIDEWQDCPAPFDSNRDFEKIAREWEDYKNRGGQESGVNQLIEFSDMIEGVVLRGQGMLHESGIPKIFGDNPEDPMETFIQANQTGRVDAQEWRGRGPFMDTKILYVDEVQDLTPLQWAWYLMQKLVCEKVYIGGDDDQTIYGWAGANPNFMLDEEGDFEVLDKTYRIPAKVWNTCDGVIQQVDKRQEKEVEPHGDGGEVVTLTNPSPERIIQHAKEGEVMILFRANYMINSFTDILHEYGIPYRNMSTFDKWGDDLVTLRDALGKIKRGEDKLTGDEAQTLIDYGEKDCGYCRGDGCSHCDYDGSVSMVDEDAGFTASEAAIGSLGGIDIERIEEIFNLDSNYTDHPVDPQKYINSNAELDYYEKEALRGCIEKGNYDLEPDRVRIGTIHSSKGKEAETVILALDTTDQIRSGMLEDTREYPDKVISDAERRVYYVGMTRASEKLVLAEQVVAESTLRLENLLESPPDGESKWEVQDTLTNT